MDYQLSLLCFKITHVLANISKNKHLKHDTAQNAVHTYTLKVKMLPI